MSIPSLRSEHRPITCPKLTGQLIKYPECQAGSLEPIAKGFDYINNVENNVLRPSV